MLKEDKKLQRAWTFYDWANSVYPLVITTAIFPIFYEGYVDDKVVFFGFEFINTALITILSSGYFLLLVFTLPILTGIADASGNKRAFMRFFCYLGSFSCLLLSFFNKDHLELSLLIYVFAGIGFWSSLVFYNAFLPEIAHEKDHDQLSAKGFSMGYFGSVILLLFCLALIFTASEVNRPFLTRVCFALTGLWWFSFSHITFKRLPKGDKIKFSERTIYRKGALELKKVWKYIIKTKRLKRFIYSFFVYSMAIQTIMLVAVYFGAQEINWGSGEEGAFKAKIGLIISVVLIQLIAIPGAHLISKLSQLKGNLFALKTTVFLWILLCIIAYLVHEPEEFYCVAGFVGLVMGGSQSISRSTFSKYIPAETKDTSSFFSFYDISEKLGIVIGMFSFGFIHQLTGSMRNSVLALILFFASGLLLLFFVPKKEILIENYEN
jgi:UMF1 family MFS transporter